MQSYQSLITKACQLDKFSIAKLISLFEDERPEAIATRQELLDELEKKSQRRAVFLGITGTPGAGKSTLVGELATRLLTQNANCAIAVLAIDPTSHISGGALLGDRTRVRFPTDEKRLFFRSQANDLDLGGLSRKTFQVCRLLHFLFDFVFVETVGIGQSEMDVRFLADRTYLVLQPMAGDHIQFMKAGIMEIPDAFIINKSDEKEAARKSYYALRGSLDLIKPLAQEQKIPIYRTSALTGMGLDELIADLRIVQPKPFVHKEVHFFEKWLREEYGRQGLRQLEAKGVDVAKLLAEKGFEGAMGEVLDNASS